MSNTQKDRLYLARKNGFDTFRDYQHSLYQEKGFKSEYDYRNQKAKEKGFKSDRDYRNHKLNENGFKNEHDVRKSKKNNLERLELKDLIDKILVEKNISSIKELGKISGIPTSSLYYYHGRLVYPKKDRITIIAEQLDDII